jgi:SAM-dependent methyltransferase
VAEPFSRVLIERSNYSAEGFAAFYDEYRPAPPATLLAVLARYAGGRPRLVVDLGCGTGLSTRPWAGHADDVVGVEANPDMAWLARERTAERNVRFVGGFAHETGLADGAADVVTCSQSFHWMDPEPTLAEVARILRPGGVFAAYDYDVPPVVHPDVDAAFDESGRRCREAREAKGIQSGPPRWPKEGHLDRIRASGHFRFVREILVHSETAGDVTRLVSFAQTIAANLSRAEAGLDELEHAATRVLGDRVVPWLVCYRVRVGVT